MKAHEYKAFISYSHSDTKWAKWLHSALENYKIHAHLVGQETGAGKIPKSLAPVFLDRAELASATDLGTMLTECLTHSWCQIVICSPKSAQSHWVNEEIKTFKGLGREHRIFSLIVDGEPYASTQGQPELECFPPALRFQLDEQGEVSDVPAEPIAADARKGKDGKRNALIKLVAGILDVGFDDLKRREMQRYQRRMALITTAASIGMLLTTTLAVKAVLSSQEAERQRVRAEIQAETANQTVDFMVSLFSVSDPSEARGNTITAREILDSGAIRIEQELAEQPVVQSTLMSTIGQVYTALGLYQEAEPLLKQSFAMRLDLFEKDALDPAELADSQIALSKINSVLAKYEEAETLLLQADELLDQSKLSTRRYRAVVKSGLAEVYYRLGKFDQAEDLLNQALQIQTQLYGNPSLEVADAIQQIGLNKYDQGDFKEAEDYFRRALTMLSEVLNNEPHPALAENINNLAYLMHVVGNYDEAEALYQKSLAMLSALLGNAHPDVAGGYSNLAFLYHDIGEYEKAKTMYENALNTLKLAYGVSHPDIAKVLNNIAYLLHDMGQVDAAVAMISEAVIMNRAELGADNLEYARCLSTQGRWVADEGDFEQAVQIHREALEIKLQLLDADHPVVAISQFDLANVLLETGQFEEAYPLAKASLESLKIKLGMSHWYVAVSQWTLAKVYMSQSDYAQAEPLLLSSYSILQNDESSKTAYIKKVLSSLVALYASMDEPTAKQKYASELSAL